MRRVFFEVDFDLVGYEYSMPSRTFRAIKHSQVSWIYLHGVELEKEKGRYWLCKVCYDIGKSKVMAAVSTGAISRHLTTHGIYLPGTTLADSNTTVDVFLEGQHPLQAERWHEHFVNWIAHDNISFEQAASPLLRKVILGRGS